MITSTSHETNGAVVSSAVALEISTTRLEFLEMRSLPLLTLLCLAIGTTFASSGDRAQGFIQCVDLCSAQNCGADSTYVMPLSLKLTRWSCLDDCKYNCMHQTTDQDLYAGKPIQQYYGKWPFWRFAGMQEPASVAFSILNLLAHWKGLRKLKASMPVDHPMRPYYLRWGLVSINAWLWSSVFHTRGTLAHTM